MLDDALAGSGVVEGKLHLRKYLRGAGGQLASAMARSGQASTGEVAALMRTLGSLEIYLPVPEHRRMWDGGKDLIVAIQLVEGEVPFGVNLDGTEVTLTLDHPPEKPVLSIVPAESFDESGNPLHRSLSSNSPGRSDFNQGFQSMSCEDEELCLPECSGDEDGCNGRGDVVFPQDPGYTDTRGISVREFITHMRATNDHEPWTQGAPEFKLLIAGIDDFKIAIPIPEEPWSGSDDDNNSKRRNFGNHVTLLVWDTPVGERLQVKCYEEDTGFNGTADISGTARPWGSPVRTEFSSTFDISGGDDECGLQYLYGFNSNDEWYSIPDGPSFFFDLGDLEWYGAGLQL